MIYYRNGSALGACEGNTGVPVGAIEITQADYVLQLNKLTEDRKVVNQKLVGDAVTTVEADVAALIKVGIPEKTARRMLRA